MVSRLTPNIYGVHVDIIRRANSHMYMYTSYLYHIGTCILSSTDGGQTGTCSGFSRDPPKSQDHKPPPLWNYRAAQPYITSNIKYDSDVVRMRGNPGLNMLFHGENMCCGTSLGKSIKVSLGRCKASGIAYPSVLISLTNCPSQALLFYPKHISSPSTFISR